MHFFIDHLELTAQAAAHGFGPDATQPTVSFNVTSRFQLVNEAKAFACQESMMIVQQSAVDATLVNVILKPKPALTIPLAVRYYVYRGILKSSLINGNQLTAQASTNNELIKRIWAAAPQDTSAGTLGFDDNTYDGTDGVGTVFDGSRPSVKPILVKEGEWIGTYTCDHLIGFEVITGNNRFLVDLNYVRAGQHQVDVTGLAGLAERIKREEVLYFIDPAAFFGMHYAKGVNYSVYSGATKTIKSTIEKINNVSVNKTYSLLLSSFSTRNRVYLDIRSEKGYSYNFYGNYGDAVSGHDVKIGQGAAATVSQSYETSQWPIVFVAAAQATAASKNKVRIALRTDDNIKPVVYIEDSKLKEENNKSNHFSGKEIVQGTQQDWTKNLSFVFPNTGTAGSKNNVACCIRIYYFRQEHNAASPNTVLRNVKYYDSAFCSVDLPRLGDAGFNSPHLKSANPNFVREALQTDGTGNFAYTAVNGAYWDDQRILFYSTLESKVVGQSSEKFYVNTYTRRLNNINNRTFTAALGNEINTLCRLYCIGGNDMKILALNSHRKAGVFTEKENVLFLGLSIAELGAIKSAAGLGTDHDRYIFLDAGNRLTDDDGVRYWSYTVQLQGLNANGVPARITPQLGGGPILVYSRDNNFFSSVAFSADEVVSPGTNRIEYHVYHDGYVKINDNIDLSLVHDAQNIFYIYHDSTDATQELCNLDVLQANKMKKGVIQTNNPPIPATYNETNDYTSYGISAKKSYADGDGNVITIGTHNGNTNYQVHYKSLSKKTFLVYFDLALVNSAAPVIDIVYSGTRRRYCMPELAAAFIGAAVDVGASGGTLAQRQITSTGFSFIDCTCFPSQTHVNGNAVDTLYKHVLAYDQNIINANDKFGFGYILKGQGTYCSGLTIAQPHANHDSHLHSGGVVLNNRDLNE